MLQQGSAPLQPPHTPNLQPVTPGGVLRRFSTGRSYLPCYNITSVTLFICSSKQYPNHLKTQDGLYTEPKGFSSGIDGLFWLLDTVPNFHKRFSPVNSHHQSTPTKLSPGHSPQRSSTALLCTKGCLFSLGFLSQPDYPQQWGQRTPQAVTHTQAPKFSQGGKVLTPGLMQPLWPQRQVPSRRHHRPSCVCCDLPAREGHPRTVPSAGMC